METLTVGELKEALEGFTDDTPVVVGSAFGDRVGTVQANDLNELVLASVTPSAYSATGYKVIEEDTDEIKVLLLNGDCLL